MTLLVDTITQNLRLTHKTIQACVQLEVSDFIIAPGGRNSSFVSELKQYSQIKTHYWSEERSASFFALGLSRKNKKPVVISVTSGTAAAELLPAAMEAYYTHVPLIFITADRPKRFRGSNAPQSAEQKNLFGIYTPFNMDIEGDEDINLLAWDRLKPCHINLCLEDPRIPAKYLAEKKIQVKEEDFFLTAKYPLVVVSSLLEEDKQAVIDFIKLYKAPVYIESVSGLKEHPCLQPYRIYDSTKILKNAKNNDYPIDAILRIGSIPTVRLWRDLEDLQGDIQVLSLSHLPFSGLSYQEIKAVALSDKLPSIKNIKNNYSADKWLKAEFNYQNTIHNLLKKYPTSEPGLIYKLSTHIKKNSLIYLGNSLPIREWDAYSNSTIQRENVFANRGVNGIDGQISTFFGLCEEGIENWAIFGDLTTIYDLAAFWILPTLKDKIINIVIINNFGGQIFSNMFFEQEMINSHHFSFKSLAEFWNIGYESYSSLEEMKEGWGHRIIEIIPDNEKTVEFNELIFKI